MSFPDLDAKRRFPSAVAALERGDAASALAAVERLGEPEALRIAGRALLALGDRDGARRAFLRALEACGPDDPGAAVAHAELATVDRVIGETAGAVRHLERALELSREPVDAGVRARLHREASVLAYRDGDLVAAERHARAVLAAGTGPANDEVTAAHDRARLGAIRSEQGDHREAVAFLRDATQVLGGAIGPAHPEVLAVRSEFAEALEAAGDRAEAETVHLEVLACREAGPGHPRADVADTLLAISRLARQRGDAVAAQAFAARAAALLQGRVSADHPQLQAARVAAASG